MARIVTPRGLVVTRQNFCIILDGVQGVQEDLRGRHPYTTGRRKLASYKRRLAETCTYLTALVNMFRSPESNAQVENAREAIQVYGGLPTLKHEARLARHRVTEAFLYLAPASKLEHLSLLLPEVAEQPLRSAQVLQRAYPLQ